MDKIKLAVIGLGKMGLSHLSIAGAHPSVELVAAVDTATMVTDFLQKFSDIPCFNDTKNRLLSLIFLVNFCCCNQHIHYTKH